MGTGNPEVKEVSHFTQMTTQTSRCDEKVAAPSAFQKENVKESVYTR